MLFVKTETLGFETNTVKIVCRDRDLSLKYSKCSFRKLKTLEIDIELLVLCA